jgi:hypothetical protein
MCTSAGVYFSTLVLKPFRYTYEDHFPHPTWIILTYLMTWKTMDWKQDHSEMSAVMTAGVCKTTDQ